MQYTWSARIYKVPFSTRMARFTLCVFDKLIDYAFFFFTSGHCRAVTLSNITWNVLKKHTLPCER